ncbi:hypothetical protein [Streptomyces sp. BP-8]|uniref:Nuclear transport factor 2 family protein n=1 Tax=Streptomyces sirii TaxID=3127701 RepID=A0ABZ2QZ12_9ACTN
MSQRNRSVVENAWKAFASHDADRISAVLTDDAEWLAPPGNATAVALEGPSHMIGKKAVVHFLAEDGRGATHRPHPYQRLGLWSRRFAGPGHPTQR